MSEGSKATNEAIYSRVKASGASPTNEAIYSRVSTRKQDTEAQEVDLKRWAAGREGHVLWFRDSATGKTMDRPGFKAMMEAARKGLVRSIVIWRLDRLGRTASGLTQLFEELQRLGVNLVSLRDGLDLSTPAGRLMSNVLASVAQYETEVRAERVLAGLAAARAAGKHLGRRPNLSGTPVRVKVTPEAARTAKLLRASGESWSAISRATGLSRGTLRDVEARG